MIEAEVTVEAVRTVGADTIAVDLATPQGFDPQPGQFVKLTAYVGGDHVSRFYTLSSPVASDTFEVTVGIDDEGTLAPWLRDAAGEDVTVEGPYGRAFYDGEEAVLVLAGGPGIGAAIGIGEAAATDNHDVAIVYRGNDPAHRDRLDALAEAGASIVVADELDGQVDSHLADETSVFVYGFQEFVTAALDAIEAAGGDADQAKVENFG